MEAVSAEFSTIGFPKDRLPQDILSSIEAAVLAGGADEKFRREVVRRVRASIAELHRLSDEAEEEMIRLRVEAGRLQKWLGREAVSAGGAASVPAMARGPRAA